MPHQPHKFCITTEGSVVEMSGTWITEALEALQAVQSGQSPPLEFLPAHDGEAPRWIQRPDALPGESQPADERAAAVVRTSGSSGTPKQTLLPWDALAASAAMTAQALGGHGQWLLTLQPSYVAGLSVLTRSLIAGTEPVGLLENSTDPRLFVEAAEQLTGERRYVALVPTQLQRLLDALDGHTEPHQTPEPASDRLLAALRRFDAILLGGGPTSPALFGRARALDLNAIRTYGMAETCGGCVYDGHPLPGVSVSIGTHGRVVLSGPMVGLGYLENTELTAEKFDLDPATGQRRYRTDDLGELSTVTAEEVDSCALVTGAGYSAQIVPKLKVTGRADDVIITGGVKVSAQQVREVLEDQPSVREAFVTGVEDAGWGQKVTAAVVLAVASREADTFEQINQAVRDELGAAAVPKHYELLGSLPMLPNGKPDMQTLLKLLSGAG